MNDFHALSSFGSSWAGLTLQAVGLVGLMLGAFASSRAHMRSAGQNHVQNESWRWGWLTLACAAVFAGAHG